MRKELQFYHAYTNGLSKNLLFKDEADFIAGMNSIPICLLGNNVKVLCFCLMSNHVHFILEGEYLNCENFIRQFKKIRGMRLTFKYGRGYDTKEAEIGVKAIEDEDYLRAAIGYVLRNPIAANMSITPWEYRWNSIDAYFANKSLLNLFPINSLSVRKRRELMATKFTYPNEYLIQDDGAIHPISYIEYKYVEKLFRSPKQLLFFLSSNKDIQFELQTEFISKANYSDQELFACLNDLSKSIFNEPKYDNLSIERRFILAKELKKRYHSKPKQIARVTGLEYELLSTLLK